MIETIKDIKFEYLNYIGEKFTEFVNDNYQHLKLNYDKSPKKIQKKINFPVFCYLIFFNVNTDNNETKNSEN